MSIRGRLRRVIGMAGGLRGFFSRTKDLELKVVKVGVPGSARHSEDGTSLAMIAAVHEFGSPDKGIPERSFLRGGIIKNKKKYVALSQTLSSQVMKKKLTRDQAYGLLGQVASDDIKEFIRDGDLAPLKPATIRRKGSSKPLIDTGQLRQSVTFIVEPKK